MSPHIVLATAADDPAITPSDQLYADALERRGCCVTGVPWDGPRESFAGADAVVLRSTWGYYRALEEFKAWTEAMATATRLFNSIDLVRWNLRKDYVEKLAAAGVRVPRSFVVPCDAPAIGQVFEATGWTQAVVKPASGASGHSVELLQRATLARAGRGPCRRGAPGGRRGAGVLAGDRRGGSCRSFTSMASLATRSASARRPASSAPTRGTNRCAPPRCRRATSRSKARPASQSCPRCRFMPASTASCATAR
jgi:hypothetical protein